MDHPNLSGPSINIRGLPTNIRVVQLAEDQDAQPLISEALNRHKFYISESGLWSIICKP